MSNRIRMDDIARAAQVDKSTVSLALRDNPRIPETTRQRIKAVAQALGYEPNPAVSANAFHRWHHPRQSVPDTIALLINPHEGWVGDQRYYVPEIIQIAAEMGLKVDVINLNHYPSAKAASRTIHARGIRGILIPPIPKHFSVRSLNLEWERFAAVCCGIGRCRPSLNAVHFHYFNITREAWRRGVAAGYRRIGAAFCCHQPFTEDDRLRVAASLGAIHLLGLPPEQRLPFVHCNYDERDPILRWYERYRPDLIIGHSEIVHDVLAAAGVRFPADCAFIGMPVGVRGGLSGPLNNRTEIIRVSLHLLRDEIKNKCFGVPAHPWVVRIEPDWQTGNSFPEPKLPVA